MTLIEDLRKQAIYMDLYRAQNASLIPTENTTSLMRNAAGALERVEKMAEDLERPYEPGLDAPTSKGIARRLRKALEGKS